MAEEQLHFIVDTFGEKMYLEVAPDTTLSEFQQILQIRTGVPVADQRLEGLPHGFTSSSNMARAAGSELILLPRDDSMDAREAEAIARQFDEDEMAESHPAPPPPPVGPGDAFFVQGIGQAFGGLTSFMQGHHLPSAAGMGQATTPTNLPAALAALEASNQSAELPEKRPRMHEDLGKALASMTRGGVNCVQGFDEALSQARRQQQPMLALLYSNTSPESGELLCELRERGIPREFVVWLCEASDPAFATFTRTIENNVDLQQRVSQALGSPSTITLPLVAILVPEGSVLEVELAVMGRVSGSVLSGYFDKVIQDHGLRMAVERSSRLVADGRTDLQAQQHSELQEALAIDRATEASRIEEEERRKAEALEAQRAEEEAQREKLRAEQRIATRRETSRAELPPEPDAGPGVVHVLIKFPDGNRAQRRFAATDPLKRVFQFLDVDETAQKHIPDAAGCALSMNFPRRSFTLEEHGESTFTALGISQQVALFVESGTE